MQEGSSDGNSRSQSSRGRGRSSASRLNSYAPAFYPTNQHHFGSQTNASQNLGPPPGFVEPPGLQGVHINQHVAQETQARWPATGHRDQQRSARGRNNSRPGFGRGQGRSDTSTASRGIHSRPGRGRGGFASHRGRGTSSQIQEQQAAVSHSSHVSREATDFQPDRKEGERPMCVICYEDLELASIGKCNHSEVCGMCSLRMRKSFDNSSCPLCKAQLLQVVITPWRERLPKWGILENQLSGFWKDSQWLHGVYIDDDHHSGVPRRKRKVSSELMAKTGRICGICDKDGFHEFPSLRSLFRHQRSAHNKAMCPICLQGLGHFPAEMHLFDLEEMEDHLKTHPRCQFCRVPFMDTTELSEHVRRDHHTCYICLEYGRAIVFGTSMDYWRHLNAEHHACPYAECRHGFIAFGNAEELREHNLRSHRGRPAPPGNHTQRLNALFDTLTEQERYSTDRMGAAVGSGGIPGPREHSLGPFPTNAGTQGSVPPGAAAEQSSGRRWPGRNPSAPPRRLAGSSGGQAQPLVSQGEQQFLRQANISSDQIQNVSGRLGAQRQEGLRMIDDDFGMTWEAFPEAHDAAASAESFQSGQGVQVERDRAELGNIISRDLPADISLGSNLSQQELARGVEISQLESVAQEAFPALPGSAPASVRPAAGPAPQQPGAAPAQQHQTSYRYPRLVSITRRCPCGRRVTHPVVPQGTEAEPLACDDECAVQARRAQLARAFDIADPDSHVPVQDRNRIATYSPELLAYAHEHLQWIKDVESLLAMFVRCKDARQDLPVMPKTQRKIVHELAAAYGLTTQSYGQEPSRNLRVFRGSNTSVPSNKLSAQAGQMSVEQIVAALAAQETFAMRLTDVDSSADLPRMFARWSENCAIEGPDSQGRAVIRFGNQSGLQEAAAAFGGGVRGKFRIDRSNMPRLGPGMSRP